MDIKAELHRLVDLLPEAEATAMIDDMAGRLWLLKRICQVDADVEAGRVYTTDQVRAMLLSRRPLADAPQ